MPFKWFLNDLIWILSSLLIAGQQDVLTVYVWYSSVSFVCIGIIDTLMRQYTSWQSYMILMGLQKQLKHMCCKGLTCKCDGQNIFMARIALKSIEECCCLYINFS